MRFYYKNGENYLSLKSPIQEDGYVEISQEEFEQHKKSFKVSIPKEKKEIRDQINTLKRELAKTDYQAIKYAEGWLTAEEFAPIKAQRQELRNRINALESTL